MLWVGINETANVVGGVCGSQSSDTSHYRYRSVALALGLALRASLLTNIRPLSGGPLVVLDMQAEALAREGVAQCHPAALTPKGRTVCYNDLAVLAPLMVDTGAPNAVLLVLELHPLVLQARHIIHLIGRGQLDGAGAAACAAPACSTRTCRVPPRSGLECLLHNFADENPEGGHFPPTRISRSLPRIDRMHAQQGIRNAHDPVLRHPLFFKGKVMLPALVVDINHVADGVEI